MDLGHPWGLLALLGIPLVIFLHRRAAHTRRVVALVALWRPAPGSAKRGARALRDPLLLVRLLIVAGVAAALAEPGWPGAASPRHVLVLDASASMHARSGAGTRFRQAQDAASRILASLPVGGEVMVVRGGSPPTAAAEWSSDPRHIRAVLDELSAGEAPKDLRAALALARARLEERPGLVHLFSDFAGDPTVLVRQAGLGPGAVRLHPVGGPAENLAIVSAAVTPLVQSPLDHQVFALVANFTEGARAVDLTLTLPGGHQERQRLALAPGARQPALFTIAATDRIELRLEGAPDALALDDRVTLVPPARRLRVLYVGDADPFVIAALRAHPGLEVTRLTPDRLDVEPGAPVAADVAVGERAAVPPGVAVPALVLGAPSPRGTRGAPVVSWQRQHPLLRGVDLRDVVVPAGRVLASAPADVLISSAEGPVATATGDGQRRRVELSFAVGDSTLGHTAAFPILVARSLDWLGAERPSGTSLAAGQPLAVNLLNADESDLRRPPSRSRDPGAATPAAPDGTSVDRWTPVRIALAIALQLLSLEIWLLQRRAGRQPA
ncbi:MAG: hypothetical protein A3F92_14050 [Candidatus Rokubacteria bacterium RIFCSPLOWO2_12_FULL_71_22]|nr:MAG: hypothetical protein A3F92_14050 [Candidatus Rokubacteria bacterium RIFCSPLOWO2_12_FULL_71_22]